MSGDVIDIRLLLSEAILFNSCTPTKFTRTSKEISNFLWNTNPKNDTKNSYSYDVTVLISDDRSVENVLYYFVLFELTLV